MKSSFILSRWKKQWTRDDVLDEVMLRDIYFFLHQRCVWRYDARGLTIDPRKNPLVRSWRYDMTPYDCDLRRYAALLSYGERFRDVWRLERDCWHSPRSSMCHLRVRWVRERRWLSAHGWMLDVCDCFVVVLVSYVHCYLQRLVQLARRNLISFVWRDIRLCMWNML